MTPAIPSRDALADLGRSILARIEEGRRTKTLHTALATFVNGLSALDGRVTSTWAEPARWRAADLALIAKCVGIELRNTLEGDGPRVVADLPPATSAIEALEARLIMLARSDFNVFVEMVATATNEKRQVVPVVQARIHRAWTKICDDPANERVIIISHNEAGKSQQLAILRPLFDLGRDPTLKSVILTNVAAGAVSRIRAISDLITLNENVRKIFPDLKPNPEGPWNTTQLRVIRPGHDKEPSIEAFGLKGAILGSRVDRIYADDLLDSENTASIAGINDLNAWWMANIETRLTRGCRVLIVGTPWRPRDLLHTLEALADDYRTFRFPIIDSEGRITWPEAWSPERIEQRRRLLSALEFARSMMCVARSNETSAFREEDLKAAVERGDGHPHIHSLLNFPGGKAPEGARIYVGVDLAASQKKGADDSAIFTLLVEASGRHTTLSIEAGKWTPSELQDRIIDHHERYAPAVIATESNGAQLFFVASLQRLGLPVRAFTTGSNKHDQAVGVEAQSTVFKNGQWVIPSRAGRTSAEVKRWIQELTFYDRNSHAGDVLMAGWIAFATAKAEAVVSRSPEVKAYFVGDGSYGREQRRLAREKEEAAARRVAPPERDSYATADKPNTFSASGDEQPGFYERLFDVRGTSSDPDREANARAARRDGGRPSTSRSVKGSVEGLLSGRLGNDNAADAQDAEEIEPGAWRLGGWKTGGVL